MQTSLTWRLLCAGAARVAPPVKRFLSAIICIMRVFQRSHCVCSGNGRCDSSDFVTNGAACSCSCNPGWGGINVTAIIAMSMVISRVTTVCAGPSCSAPFCPPSLFGASGSCNFNGLTDVTKVRLLPCFEATLALAPLHVSCAVVGGEL